MGTPYLDTSVILCSFHPNEPHKKRAMKLVNTNHLISPIVHDEIKNIYRRRHLIYSSILNLLQTVEDNPSLTLTLEDLYRRCFKANYGGNKNDSRHLDDLFKYVLDKLILSRKMKLDVPLLEKFTIKVDDIFTDIKYGTLAIINYLKNPINYNNTVVKIDIGKKYNKLHKLFKKIKGYSQNKNDINILIHGVEHSCFTNNSIDIISNDHFMIKIQEDVKKYSLKIFKVLFFEIYPLSKYKS